MEKKDFIRDEREARSACMQFEAGEQKSLPENDSMVLENLAHRNYSSSCLKDSIYR